MTNWEIAGVVELLILFTALFICVFVVISFIEYIKEVLSLRFIHKKRWKDAFRLKG